MEPVALRAVLPLTRPICFFDTETTGTDRERDRIVEFGFQLIYPDYSERKWESFINPTIPIPPEASYGDGVKFHGHGITDAHVTGCRVCWKREGQVKSLEQHSGLLAEVTDHPFETWPTFAQIAESLGRGLVDCDFGGTNIERFDLPLLANEFARTKVKWNYDTARIFDTMRIWQLGRPRTLADASQEFRGKPHEGAHRVGADVQCSFEVLVGQLERFADLPRDPDALHLAQWGEKDPNWIDKKGKIIFVDGVATMNFGKKWKGTRLAMMRQKDLQWIVNDSDMARDVKEICAQALAGNFPERRKG